MMHFLVHHAHGLEDNEIVDELVSLVMAGHESALIFIDNYNVFNPFMILISALQQRPTLCLSHW